MEMTFHIIFIVRAPKCNLKEHLFYSKLLTRVAFIISCIFK